MVLDYAMSIPTDMVRHIVVNLPLSMLTQSFLTQMIFRRPSPEQCPTSLNMTQALTLLLLTRITLAANLGLHLIIYVTHPANQIGYPKL